MPGGEAYLRRLEESRQSDDDVADHGVGCFPAVLIVGGIYAVITVLVIGTSQLGESGRWFAAEVYLGRTDPATIDGEALYQASAAASEALERVEEAEGSDREEAIQDFKEAMQRRAELVGSGWGLLPIVTLVVSIVSTLGLMYRLFAESVLLGLFMLSPLLMPLLLLLGVLSLELWLALSLALAIAI